VSDGPLEGLCGCFEPDQFSPVHAPASDVVISIRAGNGIVRDGDDTHRVSPGDIVVVEAETARRIRVDEDERLEALLVTAPPPSDAEHEPVRKGIQAASSIP